MSAADTPGCGIWSTDAVRMQWHEMGDGARIMIEQGRPAANGYEARPALMYGMHQGRQAEWRTDAPIGTPLEQLVPADLTCTRDVMPIAIGPGPLAVTPAQKQALVQALPRPARISWYSWRLVQRPERPPYSLEVWTWVPDVQGWVMRAQETCQTVAQAYDAGMTHAARLPDETHYELRVRGRSRAESALWEDEE